MVVLIATIILGISFLGIVVILFRKIPVLLSLPIKASHSGVSIHGRTRTFSYESFLQRMFSRIRTLSLRTESKTSHWLQKLRTKSHFKKDDHYWDKIKKATKSKR